MTPQQARDAAAVLLAYAERKPVESSAKYGHAGAELKWYPLDEIGHIFDFETRRYRIKPSPREWWLYRIGDAWRAVTSATDAQLIGNDTIHVREVLE